MWGDEISFFTEFKVAAQYFYRFENLSGIKAYYYSQRWVEKPFISPHMTTIPMIKEDPILLGYWNIRGRVQAIRYICEFVKAPYREHTFNTAEEW